MQKKISIWSYQWKAKYINVHKDIYYFVSILISLSIIFSTFIALELTI